MYGKSHKATTEKAIEIFEEIYGNDIKIVGKNLHDIKKELIEQSAEIDNIKDTEFIDVDGDKDDPHKNDGSFTNDDNAHYSTKGNNFTSYNHFIDIKKGAGIFDDYDGYNFNNSSNKGGYQSLKEAAAYGGMDFKYKYLMEISDIDDKPLDNAIMLYFSDEYVHTPGQRWYQNCSPSVERYSFYNENLGKKKFTNKWEEIRKRFKNYKGAVTSSYFPPIDNLGRYWYETALISKDLKKLGATMHAIQDVTIPQHVTGYSGNWHVEYEDDLNSHINQFLSDKEFISEVRLLVEEWKTSSYYKPISLDKNALDHGIPSIKWHIDELITWVALHTYKTSFIAVHKSFKHGYTKRVDDLKNLTKYATAMSVLMLIKAKSENYTTLHKNIVKTISITHTTSMQKYAGSTDNFELVLYYNECGGRIEKQFDKLTGNDRKRGETSSYNFNVRDYELDLEKLEIAIKCKGSDRWQPSSIFTKVEMLDGTEKEFANHPFWDYHKKFDGEKTIMHEIPKNVSKKELFNINGINFKYKTDYRKKARTDSDLYLSFVEDGKEFNQIKIPVKSFESSEEGECYIDISFFPIYDYRKVHIFIRNSGVNGWLPQNLYMDAYTPDGKGVKFVDLKNWDNEKWFDVNDTKTPIHEIPTLFNEKSVSSRLVKKFWILHKTENIKWASTNARVLLLVNDYPIELKDKAGINEMESGKADEYFLNVLNYNFDLYNLDFKIQIKGTDAWKPESIFILAETEDGMVHTVSSNFEIDKWLEDEVGSGNNNIISLNNYQAPNIDLEIEELKIFHTTSNSHSSAWTDGGFNLILSNKNGKNVSEIVFKNLFYDERELAITDCYDFDVRNMGYYPNDIIIKIKNKSNDGWLPSTFFVSAKLKDSKESITLVKDLKWTGGWFDTDDNAVLEITGK